MARVNLKLLRAVHVPCALVQELLKKFGFQN